MKYIFQLLKISALYVSFRGSNLFWPPKKQQGLADRALHCFLDELRFLDTWHGFLCTNDMTLKHMESVEHIRETYRKHKGNIRDIHHQMSLVQWQLGGVLYTLPT